MDITIGEAIKIGRKRKGWTQTKLAQELAVNPSLVSRWESNGAAPTAKTFMKLAELLDIVPLLFPRYFGETSVAKVDGYEVEEVKDSVAIEIARIWDAIYRLEQKTKSLPQTKKSSE